MAVLRFRDNLPENHERRERLKDVTDLRFDTQDPTICYLLDNPPTADGRTRLRRIDPTQPLDKLAEAMVLYPSHTEMRMVLSAAQAAQIKDVRTPPIRDIFLVDIGKVVIHAEDGTTVETVQDLLEEAVLAKEDETKALANKLFSRIFMAISNGTKEGRGMLIEPRLDRATVWHIQLLELENGARLTKLKAEVATLLQRAKEVEERAHPELPPMITNMIRDTLSEMFPGIWLKATDSKVIASGVYDSRAAAREGMADVINRLTPPSAPAESLATAPVGPAESSTS